MSRLCRLRNASHGDDGQWAYSEIVGLREQVAALTKERDIKEHCIVQLEAEDLRMKGQLAALAEQNEKLRAVLDKLARLGNEPYLGNSIGNRIAAEALSLPDLASPVLNRIRAEGVRKASTLVSLVRNDWASAGDNLSVQAAEYLISALDARAAELENEDAN